MVCDRCKMVVRSLLEEVDLHPISIELVEVEISELDIKDVKSELLEKLRSVGFDLLDDKKTRMIEKVKTIIIDLIQNLDNALQIPLSEYIVQHTNQDYGITSSLFSEVEGITIERYYITQKVERIKELLLYDELTISEIAHLLNYSRTAYLSNQFKKVTGLTPSHFKKIGNKKRNSISDQS